ncbi:hypothetical protein ABPG75_011946 [Micractinium tetrahymenae]
MDVLRERCGGAAAHGGELPVVHTKAWRGSRHMGRPGSRRLSGYAASDAAAGAPPLHRRASAHLLLLALLGLAVLYRAGSHLLAAPQSELADLLRLDGDGPSTQQAAAAAAADAAAAKQPKLIPRILHQTFPGSGLPPPEMRRWMASWRVLNPGWEVRLYTDQDCLEFVRREFPQYWDAYRWLGPGVERADFFRYMVILRHGGVYADVDAECRRPLDALLHSKDTLVAGWDNEWANATAALQAGYVRQRQLAQWVFAGAPGHPALQELCDRIAAAAAARQTFSSDARINALERTGAGLFTDVLLRHAAAHPPAARDDPWGVRLLPRVRFGAPPSPAFGLTPSDPGVVALHHAPPGGRSEQETSSGWSWQQVTVEGVTSEVARRWRHRSEDVGAAEAVRMAQRDAELALYPVSVDFDPPFDLLTHRLGRGERQSGADVGATLTTHGSWQPSVQPARRPSLVDALVGSMGGADQKHNVLVDVGAGYGLLSLAAAACGHRVHAFELGPASLEALEASLAHNGFEHLVQVHKEALGAPEQEGYTCILPRQPAAVQGSGSSGSSTAADVEVQRGYGPAEVHATPAEACQLMTRRSAGAWAIPETDRVAALKVSANGWEGFVLRGFAPLLTGPSRPPVLAVEWNPAAMKAAGWRRPLRLVEWLHSLGYKDISHSGFVCDQRWYSITYGVRRRGGVTPEDLAALRQPTWCRLLPQHFSLLLDHGGAGGASGDSNPETLLFVHHGEQGSSEGSSSSSSSDSAAGSGSGSGSGEAPGASQPGAGSTDEFGVPETVAQALAEAALMVADPAATHTAAAVSNLTAGPGANSSSSSSSNGSHKSGSEGLMASAAGSAAVVQRQGSRGGQSQQHQQQQRRQGGLIPQRLREGDEPGGEGRGQL